MDDSKIVKQVYVDYTSTESVTGSIYADGNSTPYYTFSLPARPDRAVIRVRFPALKFRTFRIIMLSDGDMQIWSSPKLEWKPVKATSGYQFLEINT